MFNYGVGGNSVPQEASEAMADLAQNRTLFVQQLTSEPPIRPEAVYDLKTIEEVFAHFQPNVDVDFQTADGTSKSENLRFGNVGDFGTNSITAQSPFLQEQAMQQDQYQKVIKQLRTNKLIQKVMENPETKAAFLGSLQSLLEELEEKK
jgi:hypothetical protein